MKKTAVVSDATSAGFFFPLWKRYYGGIFGLQNLHLVTYAGMKNLFADSGVGNIWELNSIYNDQLRATVISDLVNVLLHTYDVVVRCDIDEMLVPVPDKFNNLHDFVENNTLPYVTANGIDIVELMDDKELDLEKPILIKQRKFGIRSTPLNKTCVTTVPLRWAAGFHAANAFPQFSNLFNFHLKFADIKGRVKWHELMQKSATSESSEFVYFSNGAEVLTNYQKWYENLPMDIMHSETQPLDFDRQFINSVSQNSSNQIYQGHFETEPVLTYIDAKFENMF